MFKSKPTRKSPRKPIRRLTQETRKEFLIRLFIDRGSQILLGILLLVLMTGGSAGILNRGTEGGSHEFSVASVAPQGTNLRRVLANRERLAKMYPTVAVKVAACISDLEKKKDKNGNYYQPFISPEVHRTPAQQLALYKAGKSQVTYGYHVVTGPHGEPESCAADLPDYKYGWNPPTEYRVLLARIARCHGLNPGSTFFNKGKTKASAARAALNKANLIKALDARKLDYKGPLGWDPLHVETTGVTLAQAKRGLRPK